MRESCTYGSVRGTRGNSRSYRDRLGWVEQSPDYVSFIDQSVEATARLVVADRLTAPFELSKQSKLIIGQLRHEGLRRFRPKVAHPQYGRRLLRCGTSTRPMTAVGHSG